jgi:hypothetical protein
VLPLHCTTTLRTSYLTPLHTIRSQIPVYECTIQLPEYVLPLHRLTRPVHCFIFLRRFVSGAISISFLSVSHVRSGHLTPVWGLLPGLCYESVHMGLRWELFLSSEFWYLVVLGFWTPSNVKNLLGPASCKARQSGSVQPPVALNVEP